MLKNKKFLLITVSILIVLIIGLSIYLVTLKKADKTFDIVGSEKMFSVEDVIIDTEESDNMRYIKVKVTADNKTNFDIKSGFYIFVVMDKEKNAISQCYDAAYNNSIEDDIFPATIKANSITSGYVYCMLDKYDAQYLKMSYMTKDTSNNKEEYKFNDFYFDLKELNN